ncbi:MAG: hypothetical protein IJJ98_10515 [Prevotella sp.]|nr:hypothetical protein [Prevotella sp.]
MKEDDSFSKLIEKCYPEYDTSKQSIYFKEKYDYDIREEIEIPMTSLSTGTLDIACKLSFFNYGGDIILFNGCGNDCFISGLGTIKYVYPLSEDDNITITSKEQDEKYGVWAIANLSIGIDYITDVYVTPIAMKAYNDGDKTGLIFVQFATERRYMNVLFYGSPKLRIIARNCPNRIIPRTVPTYNIEGPINGPGPFWHMK